MVQLEVGDLVDVGVDWITTTTTELEATKSLVQLGHFFMSQEVSMGMVERPWTFRDYKGWRAGHVEFGTRNDEGILRLGGIAAAMYWQEAYALQERCSRIDLQATYRPPQGDVPFLVELHAMARKHTKQWTKPPVITLITNNQGGATVYMGQRKSDLYFRAYAKFAESQDEAMRGCVRLEIEVKNRITHRVINWMKDGGNERGEILSTLGDYLSRRGISSKIATDNPRSLYERLPASSDLVKKLNWLNAAVEPTVRILLERGLRDAVFDALGLE